MSEERIAPAGLVLSQARSTGMPAHQVCCLDDEAIANTQRGIWRPNIGLFPVTNIDAREGYLHSWVGAPEGIQYLRVYHSRQRCPVHHCLQQHMQLFGSSWSLLTHSCEACTSGACALRRLNHGCELI